MRFSGCSVADLDTVADALAAGRLKLPPSTLAVERLHVAAAAEFVTELTSLASLGFGESQAAGLLRVIAAERKGALAGAPSLDLVITGPDVRERARDTAVVVDQLFAEAKSSVLVVGFALFDGATIFRRLAERLDENPALGVTLCLDVSRRGTNTTKDADLIARFAKEFVDRHWPGKKLPAVYFDPRGLTQSAKERAVLHAKCIVVDRAAALITSANPTPAAYNRNIELGIVVRGGSIPSQIADHFDALIKTRLLSRVPFPSA